MDNNYTNITNDIVNRLLMFKNYIKNGMIVGDTDIIKGINIVEEIIMEINPNDIGEDLFLNINDVVNVYIKSKEKNYCMMNNKIKYGINYSLFIIESFVKLNSKLKSR